MRTWSAPTGLLVAAGVAAVALVCVVTALVVSSPSATAPVDDDPAQYELYLAFNSESDGPIDLRSSGSASVTAHIASAGGGEVAVVTRDGAGEAASFEPFAPDAPAQLAVIVVRPSSDDSFSPAGEAFTFGADFQLDAESEGSEIDNGNNLVQRGLYSGDAQYKLQVDGNRVSCRVAGSAGSTTVVAGPQLAPNRWHRASCTRRGSSVTLVLSERGNDVWEETRTWTRSGPIGELSFDAGVPLSVGGKVDDDGEVVAGDSDQFNGRVDNVFFRRLDG